MPEKTKYSIVKGLTKMAKAFVLFLIPALFNYIVVQYPQVYQISLGAFLVGVANYIKVKGFKIPSLTKYKEEGQ